MATKNVIEGSNKVSAAQLKDFFRQIDEGGITGDHIQAILERKNPFGENIETKSIISQNKESSDISGSTPTDFKIWKTIKIGTYRDPSKLREVIAEEQIVVDLPPLDIFREKSMFSLLFSVKKEVNINLLLVSLKDLGLEKSDISSTSTYKVIFYRAQSLGLKLCPKEVGPYLRLQYKDQPRGECLTIAMNPIQTVDEESYRRAFGIFRVQNENNQFILGFTSRLSGKYEGNSMDFKPESLFVFCL